MINKAIIQTQCPVCKKKRSLQQRKVIANRKDSFVIYNKCQHCLTASLVVITKINNHNKQLVAVETLTDLNQEEAITTFNKRPLTADDVLMVYQKLFN